MNVKRSTPVRTEDPAFGGGREVGGVILLFSGGSGGGVTVGFSWEGRRTLSIPWHRKTEPAVQILGLMSLALLRKKFLRPLLEMLSM